MCYCCQKSPITFVPHIDDIPHPAYDCQESSNFDLGKNEDLKHRIFEATTPIFQEFAKNALANCKIQKFTKNQFRDIVIKNERVKMVGFLGEGTYAKVYKVKYLDRKHQFAVIKVSKERENAEIFFQEAHTLIEIQTTHPSPHIIEIKNHGTIRGVPVICEEFMASDLKMSMRAQNCFSLDLVHGKVFIDCLCPY